MSRIAAVAARVEELIVAIAPESKLVAGAGKFVRSDKPLGLDAAPRTFFVDSAGDFAWTGEFTQDREGSIVDETLEITIAYRGGLNHRQVRDVIRQDALRIQYELMDPGNWADASNQWRCQRRQFGPVNATRVGDGDGGQIIVTLPVTLTYRPF